MGSRVVIDQHALATGCVHWKRTCPYSNIVKRTAQTICTGYNENIVVLESGYFIDYLCHWNWFLLSLLIFNLFLYTILILGGECVTGREPRQGRKVTLAGPKSDFGRAEKSHKGQNVTLECYNKLSNAFNIMQQFYMQTYCSDIYALLFFSKLPTIPLCKWCLATLQ